MSPKAKGVYTVKKNIERESAHYLLRHQTPELIRQLAKADERPVGTYLDRLIEEVARRVLPEVLVEQIIKAGQEEEARRREEAQKLLAEQETKVG